MKTMPRIVAPLDPRSIAEAMVPSSGVPARIRITDRERATLRRAIAILQEIAERAEAIGGEESQARIYAAGAAGHIEELIEERNQMFPGINAERQY